MKFKKLFFIFIFTVCCITVAISQKENSSKLNSIKDESEIVLTQPTDDNPEKQFVFVDEQNASSNVKKTSGVWVFLRMILVLAIVVACIYFVMNYMKKSIKGDNDTEDPYLRKVSQVTLSPGKTVQIVTVLDNCYVVGVTDAGINLIANIDDKELVAAMNLSADKIASNRKKVKSFEDVLEMFLPSKSTKQTEATQDNIYADSTKSVNEFIKTQRKRVNKKREE